jgi:asparagine synthase (glutamine-hydrolysing)
VKGLGHVRLSIIDLSPDGNQPFHDSQNDVHAIVNGELYDHERYRTELAKEYNFQGNSDCEIVLALYQHYGLSFLSHLRGEFALVLWDAKRELFFAARDRYGIKSLYYTFVDGQLLVATEKKSFLAFGWQPEWCNRTMRDNGWRFDKRTFFKGVYKVSIYVFPDLSTYILLTGPGPPWSLPDQQAFWRCGTPTLLGSGLPRQGQ